MFRLYRLLTTMVFIFVFLGGSGAFPVSASTDPVDSAVNFIVARTASAPFTADGDNTGGTEYGNPEEMVQVSGPNSIEAHVFLKRYRNPATGAEELRVYFEILDPSENSGDKIEFYFDRFHNHGSLSDLSLLADDVMIRIARSECTAPPCSVNRVHRDVSGLYSGGGTMITINNAVIEPSDPGSYVGGGWSGEFVLTPQDLGWGYFPPVVGFLVKATDDDENLKASYPTGPSMSVIQEFDPINWSNLKLRYPIDYAVVLDNSGSMLATDGEPDHRWTRAKRAADLFAAALGLFKDDYLADHISVSQYSWSCSGTDTTGDTTGKVQGIVHSPNLIPVPDPPTGTDSFTAGNSEDPASNNCTPIKRGLDFALVDQLGYPPTQPEDTKKDRIVILLSDGFHNMPPKDVPFVPATAYLPEEKAFAEVRTVALGPDGSSGTMLLSDISTEFSGMSTYEAKYNNALDFVGLLDAYLETLQEPLTINLVGDDSPASAGGSYSPGAPNKLVFIGVWKDPAQASEMTVQRNSDDPIPGAIANTQIGYAAVEIDTPTSGGSWTITGTELGVMPDARFVLADLRILARYLVEQKQYGAGEPMLLQVKLQDLDQPLLGAEVSVETAVPGEALGNYLATVQQDCSSAYPLLPQRGLISLDPKQISATASMATSSAVIKSGDPLPGRYSLAAATFERCGKDGLIRKTLPGIPLLDDGTGGDLTAGDGIYSLSFSETSLEGTYTFRFHARGTTSDGIPFTRTRTLSQFVRVKPAAETTHDAILLGDVVDGMQTAQMLFLPMDSIGNYLGPGFAASFNVDVDGGHLVGPLHELNNGIYLQEIRYPAAGPEPTVTVEMPETGFSMIVGADDEPQSEAMLGLLIWIQCIIILILLIWCWIRRRTSP